MYIPIRFPVDALATAAAMFMLFGCHHGETRPSSYVRGSEPAALSAAVDKGIEAMRALSDRMTKRKPGSVAPNLAEVAVARQDAIGEVTRLYGVSMGFTSARPRNPANAPPSWTSLVVLAPDHSGSGTKTRVFELGDKVGLLKPMIAESSCLACHGQVESFPSDLRAKLRELYPKDAAVGYSVGDICGYLWVEVTKANAAGANQIP